MLSNNHSVATLYSRSFSGASAACHSLLPSLPYSSVKSAQLMLRLNVDDRCDVLTKASPIYIVRRRRFSGKTRRRCITESAHQLLAETAEPGFWSGEESCPGILPTVRPWTLLLPPSRSLFYYPPFVCLSVLPSVCLSATSRKNYTDRILMKILPEMYLLPSIQIRKRTQYPDRHRLGGGLRSPSAVVDYEMHEAF